MSNTKISKPHSKSSFTNAIPMMELPKIALLLAIIAGLMDGYSYHVLETFSTVQSGNIILLGQSIATQNWARLHTIGFTVLAFGLGAMLTTLVSIFTTKDSNPYKKSWTPVVLLIEALILAIVATGVLNDTLDVAYLCMIISFVAGMQGTAFHKVNGMAYGNVAVTLVVQLAFNSLMQLLSGSKSALKNTILFFSILLFFAIGGFAGTILAIKFDTYALFLPALLLVLLAFFLMFAKKENNLPIDPTP